MHDAPGIVTDAARQAYGVSKSYVKGKAERGYEKLKHDLVQSAEGISEATGMWRAPSASHESESDLNTDNSKNHF